MNYYTALDIDRTASLEEIHAAYKIYKEELDAPAYTNKDLGPKRIDKDTLDLIYKTLTRPFLREAYDKYNVAMDKDQRTMKKFDDVGFNTRLMHSFGSIPQYLPFIIMLFFVVGEHQKFARKVSLLAILTSIYIQIWFKMPSEITGKNSKTIVDFLDAIAP